jgi:hypothetical protein
MKKLFLVLLLGLIALPALGEQVVKYHNTADDEGAVEEMNEMISKGWKILSVVPSMDGMGRSLYMEGVIVVYER